MNPATGNGGTCYGDSGGPNFLGAGATRRTSSRPRRSPATPLPLDERRLPAGHAVGAEFLAPFVTLP